MSCMRKNVQELFRFTKQPQCVTSHFVRTNTRYTERTPAYVIAYVLECDWWIR